MNVISSSNFNGYPVLSQHGVLVENILIGNEEVLAQAFKSHNRIAVMRFELKFPLGYMGCTEVISKFFDSLRYRLKNDLVKKTESRGRVVQSDIGYVWVKELSGSHGWHYHVALLLNYDVYNCFGLINGNNINMFNRILFSWAGAIGYSVNDARGLVHIPQNPVYKLDRCSLTVNEDIQAVLYRLSYLAKLKTKPYKTGSRKRFYGTSKR
tara:strand:- start:6123 stop:6752 length:630 start_codon:yes stop_codon:yes gene_type:complete